MMDEILDLIAKIEEKKKLVERYGFEIQAMEKRLYALQRKAREDKRQLNLF